MNNLKLDEEKIKELYLNNLYTSKEIAKQMNCYYLTIEKRLRAMGIMRSPKEVLKAGYRSGNRTAALLKATNEEIRHLYIDKKMTPGQIAKQLGYRGSSGILERLRRMNILEERDRIILRGDAHGNWQGGRTITGYGYVRIKKSEHHRASKQGYVFEHIVVWEEYHNRKLPDGWVIHHLNGIKDDNRPQNLVAMKRGEHTHQGVFYKKRIRELEIESRQLRRALEDSQSIFYINEN